MKITQKITTTITLKSRLEQEILRDAVNTRYKALSEY